MGWRRWACAGSIPTSRPTTSPIGSASRSPWSAFFNSIRYYPAELVPRAMAGIGLFV
jgi:hypothetical protein